MKLGFTPLIILIATSLIVPTAQAAIKKCQDEQGQWHYGDRAEDACGKSKIIEMSAGGHKTGEVAAPPTAAELADLERRKDELARQEKLNEKKKRKDKLLLTTYGHEKDIIYVRDRKLAQVDHSIAAAQATLDTLTATLARQEKQKVDEEHIKRTKSQISSHENSIVQKRQEQEVIKKQYDAELKRYRVLKADQSQASNKTQ